MLCALEALMSTWSFQIKWSNPYVSPDLRPVQPVVAEQLYLQSCNEIARHPRKCHSEPQVMSTWLFQVEPEKTRHAVSGLGTHVSWFKGPDHFVSAGPMELRALDSSQKGPIKQRIILLRHS